MAKFKIGQKVTILANQKMDGRYNKGVVVGIEFIQDEYYLGYTTEKEYFSRFYTPRYSVAYIDCITLQAQKLWFFDNEITR